MTESATQTLTTSIRRARPDEAPAISELAFRSKAHWGYDREFLETCREDLSLSPREITDKPVYVLVGDDGRMAGFYSLDPAEDGRVELDDLFVDPTYIGKGVGRRLWDHAVATAHDLGFRELIIQSDPHAEGFYRAMGAEPAGERESTVTPGRMLPLLRFGLDITP
jgi:GNAT superfamily N-acetyltransferase